MPLTRPSEVLSCPACNADIVLSAGARHDGAAVRCPQCGFEAVLQRERIGHDGRVRWGLIEAGDDDEP
ncbi:hypothetical protein [Solimonas terrae]|uniref:Lysine biosynthesis protein LysW n=1 Tax=Solimonas terrae TaxID=1396819 RepID=A0A6M2BM20_9GAMM|nr:hypothetical protein [Solimonas terrae]NGY03205.1 hypothetical protein [Solimonas terrae]